MKIKPINLCYEYKGAMNKPIIFVNEKQTITNIRQVFPMDWLLRLGSKWCPIFTVIAERLGNNIMILLNTTIYYTLKTYNLSLR